MHRHGRLFEEQAIEFLTASHPLHRSLLLRNVDGSDADQGLPTAGQGKLQHQPVMPFSGVAREGQDILCGQSGAQHFPIMGAHRARGSPPE